MKTTQTAPKTIEEYIAGFPQDLISRIVTLRIAQDRAHAEAKRKKRTIPQAEFTEFTE
jgi:hypothetical protein